MLTLLQTVHLSGPLHRRATCCIDTSKSGSGSAESAGRRVLLAASKRKRGSGSDGAKEQTHKTARKKDSAQPVGVHKAEVVGEKWDFTVRDHNDRSTTPSAGLDASLCQLTVN